MWTRPIFLLAGTLLLAVSALAQQPIADQSQIDADLAIQGEYVGTVAENGKSQKFGVRVAALAAGEFKAVAYSGGLPGDGWDKKPFDKNRKLVEMLGLTRDGVTVFASLLGGSAVIKDGVMSVRAPGGEKVGEFKRVVRQSPTLGAKPPAGAIVLFDGTGLDHFLTKSPQAKMTDDKLLMPPARTKQSFLDFTLHLEFRTPFKYGNAGHSGVYLQNSYHLTVAGRSFGSSTSSDLTGGGIRWVRGPDQDMTFPPLAWQTYDVEYTAALFDADGKVIKKPIATIRHNGVLIHDQVELPENPPFYRGGGTDPLSPQGGPLQFQHHADDRGFVYRNIWLLEKK